MLDPQVVIDAFIAEGGPRFTAIARALRCKVHTVSKRWYNGWPTQGIPPICESWEELTGKKPPPHKAAPKKSFDVYDAVLGRNDTEDDESGQNATAGSASLGQNATVRLELGRNDTVNGAAPGSEPAPPGPNDRPTQLVKVAILNQREIDRLVSEAVTKITADMAAALFKENQMLQLLRNNIVGTGVLAEAALVALKPHVEKIGAQLEIDAASGKLSAEKILSLLQTLTKIQNASVFAAGAAMQHQRLLAGKPQVITETRTGEAEPRTDVAADMASKLSAALARARTPAQGGDYEGEESGRPDAIDVDVDDPTEP